jgi:two-component system sensor histidine kinase KdpD
MPPIATERMLARRTCEITAALAACTAASYLLEGPLGLPNASAVYLLGIAAVAIRSGATPAIVTAVGAFLTYNFVFIEPRYTFTVADPEQLLNLILFLIVGVLIARLAGRQRDQERDAQRREAEARTLYSISRALNTSESLEIAVSRIVERLAHDTRMQRVWVGVGVHGAPERPLADTDPNRLRPNPGSYRLLVRDDADGPAVWRRIHLPQRRAAEPQALYRVKLAVGDESFGSLWTLAPVGAAESGPQDARLLAAAADQIAQAVRRQQLTAAAAEVEVARRSDRLKSALLDSVSHDLRTPLSTIRAAAGNLADPELVVPDAERIALGNTIDGEAARLNRLVTNLLDMSRIDSGALRPGLELVPLGPIAEAVTERLAKPLSDHPLAIDLPVGLPPVWADPMMLDQVLTNLLENASRYAPTTAAVRVSGRLSDAAFVSLTVEDAGPGIAGDHERLFDKFHREPGMSAARRGAGLGLAVVRGLVEAMGGRVQAGRSPLGGLAIVVDLPAGPGRPADLGPEQEQEEASAGT